MAEKLNSTPPEILSDEIFEERLKESLKIIADAARESRAWDFNREGTNTTYDSQKSVIEWIGFMETYAEDARHAATGTFDKNKALRKIVSLGGLVASCLIYKRPAPKE